MAHHASALKKIRQIAVSRLRNRYQAKTTRNLIRDLRNTKTKAEATALYSKVASKVDKLAKTGVIHKNNASNQKSRLSRFINRMK